MKFVGHIGIIADDPNSTGVHTYDGPLIMTPLLSDKVERYKAVLEPAELVHGFVQAWFDQEGEEAMALALAMIDVIPEGHCSGFVMSVQHVSDTLVDICVDWLDEDVTASDAEVVITRAMDRVDAALVQRRGANGS